MRETLVGRCVWDGLGEAQRRSAPGGPAVHTGQRTGKLLEDGLPSPLGVLATWRSPDEAAGHWAVRQAEGRPDGRRRGPAVR